MTDVTNKSLLPVYDRPLIEYPLSVLLKAGIRDIAVITGPEHMSQITSYLRSESRFDCTFSFKVQEKPGGIAEALGLAEEFAEKEPVCAILGDNIYFDDLTPAIQNFTKGGRVFLKEVPDPKRFGVAEVDGPANGALRVLSIEEKPKKPKSNFAVTGCYVYDNRCFDVIKHMKPSARGELEITDVSAWYLAHNELTATVLQDAWIDAGTFESLYQAAAMVRERKL